MKRDSTFNYKIFHSTAPLPCPYIKGRVERRVVAELTGQNVHLLHEDLTNAGFRRSHGICYAPACPSCQACIAVRIIAREFFPSKSQRRCTKKNGDLGGKFIEPHATSEQYLLFCKYQNARHNDGDMASMSYFDFKILVEDTPVNTFLVEFRTPDKELIAACLIDKLKDGLSAVYSFFDPKLERRGLGNYIILWLIMKAQEMNMSFVYIGFWIKNCTKMSYKDQFKPFEYKTLRGWQRIHR